jgi:hypothetical protein
VSVRGAVPDADPVAVLRRGIEQQSLDVARVGQPAHHIQQPIAAVLVAPEELDRMLGECDIVVLSCALTPETLGRRLVPLSPTLLSGREALLEGLVLGLSGPIDEKPADQPCSRSGGRTEPGIPADRAKDGADASARSGAGKRALLGRGHIGVPQSG